MPHVHSPSIREPSSRFRTSDSPETKSSVGRELGDGGQRSAERSDERRPNKRVIFVGVAVATLLVVGGLLFWLHARQFASTDDAYTTGHVHVVSSRVAGTVSQVLVDDNEAVRADQVIVRLDPRDLASALARSKAEVAQAQAQLVQQKAAVGEAQAQVKQADAQLEKARLDYQRATELYAKKVESKMDLDAVTAALATTQAQAESARASETSAEANVGVAQANLAASVASESAAELNLSYCDIVAPVAGRISKKTVEEGQRLQPGQALLAVVPDVIWVVANLKETQLDRVQIGQRVDIRIDALPHRIFFGKVQGIQEGSGATFSLLPPDNATGNFTKIVQRVPVKIVFDPDSINDFRDKIIPGLSVVPRIDLESLRSDKREAKREERKEEQNRRTERGG